MRKLVTCPETAHLEQIEYEIAPLLGTLIVSCTRYPGCRLSCPRTCAARMDRKGMVIEAVSLLRRSVRQA